MRRFRLTLCFIVALLPLIGQAAPQRIHVDAAEYPFSAIGRLNVGGHGYCSAVLVAERIVLTAAHCLWLPSENRWWPPSAGVFCAGLSRRRGAAALARRPILDCRLRSRQWRRVRGPTPSQHRLGGYRTG